MKRLALVVCITAPACVVTLERPSQVELECERDADCPGSDVCNTVTRRCVRELDADAPRLVGADATSAFTVQAQFSEPLASDKALDTEAYEVEPALVVHAARLHENGREVELTTDAQAPGAEYTLRVSGLLDPSGNEVDPLITVAFTGYGILQDERAPDPLQPAAGGVAPGLQATLRWTPRLGAASYHVEVARDAGFTDSIDGSPFTTTDTTLTVSLDEPITYHWRVRADITTENAYGVSSFDAIGDAIYVYCPASEADDCTSRTGETGSRSHPLGRPSRAVAALTLYGATQIHIAARGSAAPYLDVVRLQGVGGTILGGFDASFGARDPVLYPTVIRSPDAGLEVRNNPDPVHIEGLRLESAAPVNAVGVDVIDPSAPVQLEQINASAIGAIGEVAAVRVQGAEASVRIVDSVLQGGRADISSTALMVQGGQVIVSGSTLSGGSAESYSVGVWMRDGFAPVVLQSCQVTGGEAFISQAVLLEADFDAVDAYLGIHVFDSTLTGGTAEYGSGGLEAVAAQEVVIERSVIWSNTGGEFASGTAVMLSSVGSGLLRNNLIGAEPNGGGAALHISYSPALWGAGAAVTVMHNTLVARDLTYGDVLVLAAAPAVLVGNLLVSEGGMPCAVETIIELDGARQPATLVNNGFVGCPEAYISETILGTGAGIDALDGQLAVNTGGETTRASGNIVATQTVEQIFTDPNAGDYRLATAADADGLATAGGDPTTLICGTHESGVACPAMSEDLTGAARTAPISLGAYEAP